MKHKIFFHFVVMSILLVAMVSQTNAQWYRDANRNTKICGAANDQEFPKTVSDGAGGAIIVWADYRSATNYDIYAQRIDAGGDIQWTTNGVAISTASESQKYPEIVSDGLGGAIITWQDERSGPEDDIYAQRINAAGVVQWTTNGVAISTTGHKIRPEIMSDGSAGAIIVWEHYQAGNWDIYAQRINSAGVVQWTTNGVAISTASGDQGNLEIVSDGLGGAIIAWQDERSGNWDIYAQRINSAGTVQWTANGVAISTASGDQGNLEIVSSGTGGAIITWVDKRSGTNYDIYAQRITAGVVQWTTNGVAISTATNDQINPEIVSDGLGGAIIAWYDYRSGTNYDIYAQRITISGFVQWLANGRAICTSPGNQENVSIAADNIAGGNGAIITWEDNRGASKDIYARRISFAGTVQWTSQGVPISIDGTDQLKPDIVSDGASGAIIAWQDERPGTHSDIYVQNVDENGLIGLRCPAFTNRYNNDPINKLDGMGFKIPTVAKLMTRNIAVDSYGNTYVTGYSDGGTTKLDYLTIKYDFNGNQVWAARYDGPAHKNDKAYGITFDVAGNVYVTGESDGGATGFDIATVKYNSAGAEQWVRRYNNDAINKRDAGYAIAYDWWLNRVFVTGETDGGSTTKSDYVTLAYSAAGTLLWGGAKTYNGPGSKLDKAYAIVSTSIYGHVAVTGESDGGSAAKADYFTILYSASTGATIWEKRYNGPVAKKDYAFGIKFNWFNQDIVVTGASEGISKFDYVTIAYKSADGAERWTAPARYDNAKNDLAYDVTSDASGYVYVTGASEGITTKYDYATIKYHPTTGNQIWDRRHDGGISKKDVARSVAVTAKGENVFVTGSSEQGAGKKWDFMTLRLIGTNGAVDWSGTYNGTGLKDDHAFSIVVRPDVYCVGLSGSSISATKVDYMTIQGAAGSVIHSTAAAIAAGSLDDVNIYEVPTAYTLLQNYPNPFNPVTTISFGLPLQSLVSLKVYNVLGQEVALLLDGELMDEGAHEVNFDAQRLGSGVYFYKLSAQAIAVDEDNEESESIEKTFVNVKKMLMVK